MRRTSRGSHTCGTGLAAAGAGAATLVFALSTCGGVGADVETANATGHVVSMLLIPS